MPGGGWVATHEDVTEQRQAELQRTSMLASRRAAAPRSRRPSRASASGSRTCSRSSATAPAPCRRPRPACSKLVRADLAARRKRGALLQRGLDQRRDRRHRRRRAVRLDRRDQRAAGAHHRRGARLGQRSRDHQCPDRGPCRGGAEDRRRGQADQRHRRADQPAGAQRHHRGGARGRSRPRLRGGRLGGEVARGADRQGHRGDRRADPRGAGLDRAARSRRSAASADA